MTTWPHMYGMATELQKVAKKRKADLDAQDRKAELGGALMMMGAPRAAAGAQGGLAHAAITGAEKATDEKLTKRMLRQSGEKHFIDPKAGGFDAHAMPKGMLPKVIRKRVEEAAKKGDPGAQQAAKMMREGVYLKGRAGMAPTIAAHELGHMDIGKRLPGRMLQNLPTALAMRASPAVGALSGIIAGAKSDPESESAAGKAMIAPGVAAAPGLGYEGLAHAKGIKHMRRAGMKPGRIAKEMLRTNLPAYLTYATLPAAGVGAAYGGTKAIQAWRRRQKRRKEAEPEEA